MIFGSRAASYPLAACKCFSLSLSCVSLFLFVFLSPFVTARVCVSPFDIFKLTVAPQKFKCTIGHQYKHLHSESFCVAIHRRRSPLSFSKPLIPLNWHTRQWLLLCLALCRVLEGIKVMIMSSTNGNDWGERQAADLTFRLSSPLSRSCLAARFTLSHFVHIKIQQIDTYTHVHTAERREKREQRADKISRSENGEAKCRFSEVKTKDTLARRQCNIPSNDLICAVYSICTGQHINVRSMLPLSPSPSLFL